MKRRFRDNAPQGTCSDRKCFNPVHLQTKGGLLNSVPETSEFTKPQGSYECWGFSERENQERASKFGSILGHDRGLVNNCSTAAGRAPNWTGRILNYLRVLLGSFGAADANF